MSSFSAEPSYGSGAATWDQCLSTFRAESLARISSCLVMAQARAVCLTVRSFKSRPRNLSVLVAVVVGSGLSMVCEVFGVF